MAMPARRATEMFVLRARKRQESLGCSSPCGRACNAPVDETDAVQRGENGDQTLVDFAADVDGELGVDRLAFRLILVGVVHDALLVLDVGLLGGRV